jgi:hypothetical protein
MASKQATDLRAYSIRHQRSSIQQGVERVVKGWESFDGTKRRIRVGGTSLPITLSVKADLSIHGLAVSHGLLAAAVESIHENYCTSYKLNRGANRFAIYLMPTTPNKPSQSC